jgi:hypothetical protein
MRLVRRDPDLVEKWMTRQIGIDAHDAVSDLPDQAGTAFPALPRDHRDRLMRLVQGQWFDSRMLGLLVGDDMDWLGSLLDRGVIGTDDAIWTIGNRDYDVPARVAKAMRLATVLVRRGVDPREIAGTADLGGWTGERSAHNEAIRGAFEATPLTGNAGVDAVRAAGIEIFAQARDEALSQEHERRITGDL